MQVWKDKQWLHNFQMQKATSLELCAELASDLQRKYTRMRAAFSVEKHVAIAVWKLATPDCYRSWLPTVMYDSRERQKFISDAQYVREMQHKMDSEYQACLRRQEQNREQTEKKREQHARQEQRQKTLSSIYATRSYERPWISGIPVTRQTSADEGSGSAIKPFANRSDSKFPAIEKTSSKQKQKPPMSSSKVTPVLDLDGSSRFSVRRPLSPIRSRDSFSATESYESSSPIVSTPEDNSLLDDMSDLQNQSSAMSSITACDTTSAKEINKHADPEKLKKLQESLLAEDSEEEGDQCRICQIAGGSLTNPLVEPCGCVGTLQFVHQECLKTWLKAKIKSGAELGAVKTCELCKQSLIADLDDFDVNDYYRNHQQSRAQSELMNSGLYLVLLLHLYEQRFAELMRLNYNQASRDRLSRQPRAEENENSESGNNG
ncbi:probable E3 ubiquitin-protein ligase MARCH10 [Terrapene carolina triunguis]|uniref:probable E3 ubiquitin-protein ligase MARCH10 n=1 Tax=Terrapene triunguis TaxID=2587831 RepID=UPI0011568FD0|nr:probable E3 ubiquitin-protein ligase MARCH10 [Terrapene carolina triunguis]